MCPFFIDQVAGFILLVTREVPPQSEAAFLCPLLSRAAPAPPPPPLNKCQVGCPALLSPGSRIAPMKSKRINYYTSRRIGTH